MTTNNHLKGVFKDKKGNTVLWQRPNVPIYGWIIFKLLALIVTEKSIKSGFEQLSTAFLLTWAYLELTKGASYFRKILGFIVFILIFYDVLFD